MNLSVLRLQNLEDDELDALTDDTEKVRALFLTLKGILETHHETEPDYLEAELLYNRIRVSFQGNKKGILT